MSISSELTDRKMKSELKRFVYSWNPSIFLGLWITTYDVNRRKKSLEIGKKMHFWSICSCLDGEWIRNWKKNRFQLIDFVINMLHGSNHWRMEMRLVMNAWSCRTSNSNTKNNQPHFNGTHHIKKWLLSIFICHGPWLDLHSTFYRPNAAHVKMGKTCLKKIQFTWMMIAWSCARVRVCLNAHCSVQLMCAIVYIVFIFNQF